MNRPSKIALVAATVAAFTIFGSALAAQRSHIHVVGSSTVFPFSTFVAENFNAKHRTFPSPVVESTGTGGGLKLFCQGVGLDHPDVTGASRPIKQSEIDLCAENGVTEIVELMIGFDGIVVANSNEVAQIDFSKEQLFLGLSKYVPVDGVWVENPYTNWSEIDDSLPDQEIRVYGPPPTSGTRDAFIELAIEPACEHLGAPEDGSAECGALRQDGHFIEAGENDNLIVQKLGDDLNALGIFGFSFLDQNPDQLQGSLIDGVEPTFDNIADGSYGVSRSLFVYVKGAHLDVVPGLKQFLAEYISEEASGEYGYLTDKGLIPLLGEKRAENVSKVEQLIE